MKRLDPKLDVVFKLLLTRERRLLADMLEGVLARPVGMPEVIDSTILGDRVGDKKVMFDIHAVLADGSRADVEMQGRATSDFLPRLSYYGARDYSTQLRQGEGYDKLTATHVIVWLNESLFPTLGLHSIFELRERHANHPFGIVGGPFSFHILQLPHLSPSQAMGYAGKVERWARFFTASSDAERRRLATEDPIMSLANRTLDQLSKDRYVQYMAERQADQVRLQRHSLATSEAKGQATVLLRLLGLRFGPVSEQMRQDVEAATLKQLAQWTERILTARTIEEVFAL